MRFKLSADVLNQKTNEVANEQKDVEHLLSKLHSRWPDIKHLLEC
ncbi:hypothetical protein VPUCM_p0023 (plasmid) [Vibrio parahaemolyticus UCM-V493]|nr:hypothetical protein VPUCM_p0023 [Vibrio parahaemolyticus UCM-V493]